VIAFDEVLIVFAYLSGFFLPQRVVLSIMGFLAIVNAYTMRICLSLAITEMVIKKPIDNSTDGMQGYCPEPNSNSTISSGGGDFDWSSTLQGYILSSFFAGYVSQLYSRTISSLKLCSFHSRSSRTFPAEFYLKNSVANIRSAWAFCPLQSSL
jgi:hypothetical protein